MLQPPSSSRDIQSRLLSTISRRLLHITKEGHFTTFLGQSVLVSLITLTVKKAFTDVQTGSCVLDCVHCLLSCHQAPLKNLTLSSLHPPTRYLSMYVYTSRDIAVFSIFFLWSEGGLVGRGHCSKEAYTSHIYLFFFIFFPL